MLCIESVVTVVFVNAVLLAFPLNILFSAPVGDPFVSDVGDDMLSAMPDVLDRRPLIASFHPSACTSPMLHPKLFVHCRTSSGYSIFSEPDMAINWQNETTSHTDGESGETVDAVACKCDKGIDKIAAEDSEATRLAMAERATAPAVRDKDAMVISGDCALTVLVNGTDAQRMGVPAASKS